MNISKKIVLSIILTIAIICITKISLADTGTINVETLKLRKSPSMSSTTLDLLDKGEKIDIIEEDGDWYKVKARGITGYVYKQYVKVTKTNNSNNEQNNNQNTENNNQTNNQNTQTNPVNNEQQNNNQTSNEQTNNTQENSNETNNNEQNEQKENNSQKEEQLPEKITTNKEIDIYILPLINSSKISKTDKNEEIYILGSTNNWIYISTNKVNGWIVKQQVENELNTGNNEGQDTNVDQNGGASGGNTQTNPSDKNDNGDIQIEKKTMYVNSPSIYVRKGPGTNYSVVDSLVLNDSVSVIAENGDWYKVKLSDKEGYIAKRLLSNSKKESTSRGEVDRNTQEENNKAQEEDGKITNNSNQMQTSSNITKGEELVEYAKQFLGCKYVYGGVGPTTFDCSGFTMYIYQKYGINLSHSATAQSKVGTYVSKEELKPGDLVFFKDYETMNEIGHCGIYIGNGEFIHASSGTGYCVKISTLLTGSYNTRYETARRVL